MWVSRLTTTLMTYKHPDRHNQLLLIMTHKHTDRHNQLLLIMTHKHTDRHNQLLLIMIHKHMDRHNQLYITHNDTQTYGQTHLMTNTQIDILSRKRIIKGKFLQQEVNIATVIIKGMTQISTILSSLQYD